MHSYKVLLWRHEWNHLLTTHTCTHAWSGIAIFVQLRMCYTYMVNTECKMQAWLQYDKWKQSRSVVSDSLRPVDCSPPSSSVHGILQARILEWVAISFSRRSSQPSNWTWISCVAGRFFTNELWGNTIERKLIYWVYDCRYFTDEMEATQLIVYHWRPHIYPIIMTKLKFLLVCL